MTDPLLENIRKFENARDGLKEQVRQAHSLTKEMRNVGRDAGRQIETLKEFLEQVPTVLDEAAARRTDDAMDAAIRTGLETYQSALQDQIAEATDRISKKFDRLYHELVEVLLNGDKRAAGPELMTDMIRRHIDPS
jgi:predicted site-specific integrase-resolvase